MSEAKESLTIYRDGTVFLGKHPGEHIEKEYALVRDETYQGHRVIELEEKDLTTQKEKARRLANLIAERIGEEDSKAIKELFYDIFKDYYEKTLDKLIRRIERGEPVKAAEGCFKIIIGDGRTLKSEHIMLRG